MDSSAWGRLTTTADRAKSEKKISFKSIPKYVPDGRKFGLGAPSAEFNPNLLIHKMKKSGLN